MYQLFDSFSQREDRSSMTRRPTLVVGVGSHHGDDQAGWLVADLLAASASEDVAVRKAKTPAEILDWFTSRV